MEKDLEIKHINNFNDFETLKLPWEKLLKQNEINDVFLTWEWLIAWWKTYGSGKDLWLITVWKNNELAGCAPLMLIKKKVAGIEYRILQSMGSPEGDVSGFLVQDGNKDVIQALFKYITQKPYQWDLLYLKEFQYSTLQTANILSLLDLFKLRSYIKIKDHYYIPIKGTWESYVHSLSKNTRKSLSRRKKRAKETGELSYERVQGKAITGKHFEIIFGINKLGNFPNLYADIRDQSFHHELARRMQSKGWVNIDILYIDSKPVAFQYGFLYERTYEDWQGGFDKTYHKLSLGKLLLSISLERLFKKGYSEHNFLRGNYEYKLIWNSKPRKYVKIYASAPKNMMAQVIFILYPRIKRWLKSTLIRSAKQK